MATEPDASAVAADIRTRAVALSTGALVGPLFLAMLEATRVDAVGFLDAFGAAASALLLPCIPALLFLALAGVPTLVQHRNARLGAVLQALLAAALSAALVIGLWSDQVIVRFWGTWAALLVMVAVFGAELLLRTRWPRVSWGVCVGAAIGAVGLWWGNYTFVTGAYEEVHWAWTNVTLVLLGLAWGHGLLAASRSLPTPRRRAVSLSVAAFAGVVLALASATAKPDALRHIAADSEVGRARLLFAESTAPKAHQPTSSAGHGGLRANPPLELPPDFDLAEWDVLFVASEAIRWDDTTLRNPKLTTTPNMVAWRDRGALDFSAGYAPSSGTLQTLASWFALAPPACTPLSLYKPHWAGKLRSEATTVAEIFAESGRHTFWIGHNFRNLFIERIHGFEQGFEHVWRKLEMSAKGPAHDDETGDRAAAYLREIPPDQRFFGFVMFSGPHFRYRKYFDDMPSKTGRDRYRQEIRKVDQQIGKIRAALEETGRLDRTIVIITADHGEEFKDHGATGHNRKLYDESIRVPMLVWFPGATADDLAHPVSNALILPWLMLHGIETRDATAAALTAGWDPMLDATSGAVVAELLRGRQSLSAVVTPRTKLLYNLQADRVAAFDRVNDPKERKKRYELTAAERKLVDGYYAARQDCERVVDTRKRPPKIEE